MPETPPAAVPVRFPPGIAGKRRKPWLEKHARLRRSLRGVIDWDGAHMAEVADLWVASWGRTMPAIDFEARRPWIVDRLSDNAARGVRILLAMNEVGEIAGFVSIDPADGWLDQIAVRPDLWGAGFAEALIGAARRVSPTRVGLDVNADNPRAVAFYEKQGFVRTGEGRNPRSGLPTLILEWRPGAEDVAVP